MEVKGHLRIIRQQGANKDPELSTLKNPQPMYGITIVLRRSKRFEKLFNVLLTIMTLHLHRNESISKQVCPSILNNSAFRATQVAVIGQPEASLPNRTKVEFAVLLPPESSSKPLVVVNTTLEYIVWESAHYINKHFNKTVLVNNLHQPSDKCIDIVDSKVQKKKNHAAAIGITFAVVILLAVSVVVVVCYR